MGVYDFVVFDRAFDLPQYGLSEPYWAIPWQTRAFPDCAYRLHYISEDGKLYRAHHSYESGGLAASHGDTGSFEFIQSYMNNSYVGRPYDHPTIDWYRVRYVRTMRITSQNTEGKTHRYDIEFNRHDIEAVDLVDV